MRLIDADALFALFSEQHTHNKQLGQDVVAKGWQGALQLLYDAPTIDPIHAAGGCYCRECIAYEGHICKNTGFYKSETGWCDDGVPREAQE